jgi:hypothetical protein
MLASSAPNKGKPYSQVEIDLILSLVPNNKNTTMLAKVLGRSGNAIGMIYQIAYGGKLLKNNVDGIGNDVFDKIADAKKRAKIFIGYQPRD